MRKTFVVAVLVFSAAACAPRRIVQLDPPGVATQQNAYAGRDVFVSDFIVRNKGRYDDLDQEAGLRDEFASYLTKLGGYRSVSASPKGAPAADSLFVNAAFDLGLKDERNYIVGLPAFVPFWGFLWPFHPRHGQVTVTGTVSVFDAQHRLLGSKTASRSEPFDYVIYGFFRTSPIEDAYKLAYEDVFGQLAVPLESSAPSAVPAVPAPAAVYRSDVDVPSYSVRARPDDFAVVIGIEKYESAPPATFAERDARAVREHLRALGYPDRNIVYLTQGQATLANIEKYVESWLPRNVGPKSRVFFYFSGHGAPDIASGSSYLVPWDGDPKFLDKTGYPLARLYRSLNALQAPEILVAMDSCFSGAGGRSVLPGGARPLVTKSDLPGLDVGRLVVLTASGADEITGSADAEGHGLFTYQLLKALNAASGALTVKQLYDAVAPAVEDAARRDNRDQTPQLLPVKLGHRGELLVRGK